MSTRTKKLLPFLLVFALVLQMLPMSVFAEEVQLAEDPAIPITLHPDPTDSMFRRDNKAEYKKALNCHVGQRIHISQFHTLF